MRLYTKIRMFVSNASFVTLSLQNFFFPSPILLLLVFID
jgi:hypothetical protein